MTLSDKTPLLNVGLTVAEAETLIAAWNGNADAINSPLVGRAIDAIADQLDNWEANA